MTALFLAVDLAFVGSNLLKIPHGGWFPLVVAGLVFILMSTWKKGRVRLAALVRENTLPMDLFLQDIRPPAAAPGARGGGLPHVGYDGARRRCCSII